MKSHPAQTRLRTRSALALLAAMSACQLNALTFIKADNADNLNLSSAWTDGLSTPGAADIASWNNTVTSANAVALGADTSWAGILVSNPAGAVTINAGNTLTVGATGIDLSAATADLSIAAPLVLGATQTWTVNTGRALSVTGGTTGAFALNKAGAGTLNLTAATGLSSLAVNVGTVNLSGANSASAASVATGASLTLLAGASLDLGTATLNLASGNGSAFFNLNGQTFANNAFVVNNRSAYITGASGESTLSGTVSASSGVIRLTSSTTDAAAKLKITGGINSTGGNGVYSDNGNVEFAGTMSSSFYQVGRNSNTGRNAHSTFSGTSTTNLTGGGLLLHNTSGANSATVTIKDTASVTTTAVDIVTSGTGLTHVGVLNLDGGTLTTSVVRKTAAAASGTFNFNGGTLRAKDATAATFFTGLTAANVLAGGAIIDTDGFSVTINQALLGSVDDGGLTKQGLGTLTLSGVNTYVGGTNVEAGILALTQDFTLSSENSLTITASAAPVAGTDFGGIVFSGTTLTYGGDLDLLFTGTAIADTTYDLFSFVSGSAAGAFENVSIGGTHSVNLTNNSGIWTGTADGLLFTFIQSDGDLLITSAIPEPSAFAAIAGVLGLGCAALRRRRSA